MRKYLFYLLIVVTITFRANCSTQVTLLNLKDYRAYVLFLNISVNRFKDALINCSKSERFKHNTPTEDREKCCFYVCNVGKRGINIPDINAVGNIIKINRISGFKATLTESEDQFNVNITAPNIWRIYQDDLRLQFSSPNISCDNSSIRVNLYSIACQLNPIYGRYNSSVKLYYSPTGFVDVKGRIIINYETISKKWLFILILIPLLCIIGIIIVWKVRKKYDKINEENLKRLDLQEMKYAEVQKKTFLEYQTAINSFANLGSLNRLNILSFADYADKVTNLSVGKIGKERSKSLDDFESFILDSSRLVNWIEKIEVNLNSKQRSNFGSLLTIILFQHPSYFIEVMELMLERYVTAAIKSNEEITVFRSSAVVEKIVGDWLSYCLYPSLENGEIGRRFFNLYRAVKCKIDMGLVDFVTNKAKYALSFDHMSHSEKDYQILNIIADVDVELESTADQHVLKIHLENLEVHVLSLDCISQVKQKILDQAFIKFSELQSTTLTNLPQSIVWPDGSCMYLYMKNNTTKIRLEDIDQTSEVYNNGMSDASTNFLLEEYVFVNTMRHFNLKSGNRFVLTTCLQINPSPTYVKHDNRQIIHLQIPVTLSEESRKNSTRASFKKTSSNEKSGESKITKEAFLMVLLSTKKSLYPFIEGFFQCLTNCKPMNNLENDTKSSDNSLFDITDDSINIPTNIGLTSSEIFTATQSNEKLHNQHLYCIPIFYWFNVLDKIYNKLDLKNPCVLDQWKSNSLILRFWVNMIKNPDFIFFMKRSQPIDASMTTIATVLMEACSNAVNIPTDTNLPIVKQLFYDEVRTKYNRWWSNFTMNSKTVEKECIVHFMTEIIEKYDLKRYYNNTLESLKTFGLVYNKQC